MTRPIEERLIEYKDSLSSVVGQLSELIYQLEFKHGANAHTDPLKDGIKFYTIVANDLQKIIDGEELKTFKVTGMI